MDYFFKSKDLSRLPKNEIKHGRCISLSDDTCRDMDRLGKKYNYNRSELVRQLVAAAIAQEQDFGVQ